MQKEIPTCQICQEPSKNSPKSSKAQGENVFYRLRGRVSACPRWTRVALHHQKFVHFQKPVARRRAQQPTENIPHLEEGEAVQELAGQTRIITSQGTDLQSCGVRLESTQETPARNAHGFSYLASASISSQRPKGRTKAYLFQKTSLNDMYIMLYIYCNLYV